MHTSAHSTNAHQLLQWSGTLIHAAEARMRLLDGHSIAVPVLCLDIVLDNTLHNLMHVEQPFPPDHFKQAEAAARRLKKGMRVTVDVPPLDLRFTARNAAHIHVIKPTKEPA
jgi:hypothetical protein